VRGVRGEGLRVFIQPCFFKAVSSRSHFKFGLKDKNENEIYKELENELERNGKRISDFHITKTCTGLNLCSFIFWLLNWVTYTLISFIILFWAGKFIPSIYQSFVPSMPPYQGTIFADIFHLLHIILGIFIIGQILFYILLFVFVPYLNFVNKLCIWWIPYFKAVFVVLTKTILSFSSLVLFIFIK
jgi:hypothetical protein